MEPGEGKVGDMPAASRSLILTLTSGEQETMSFHGEGTKKEPKVWTSQAEMRKMANSSSR